MTRTRTRSIAPTVCDHNLGIVGRTDSGKSFMSRDRGLAEI
jgi:hypothetical protein